MERIKISKEGKRILLALNNKQYPSQVPDQDYNEFTLLEVEGLVRCVNTKGEGRCEKHAARLTEEGIAYITSNPSLKNPSRIDWKWVIGIVITLVVAAATIWFSKR